MRLGVAPTLLACPACGSTDNLKLAADGRCYGCPGESTKDVTSAPRNERPAARTLDRPIQSPLVAEVRPTVNEVATAPKLPLPADDLATFGRYLTVERNLSPATQVAYTAEVRSFLGFTGTPFRSAGASDVRDWILHRGGAPSTVVVRLAALKAYCKFLRIPNVTEDIDRPKRAKLLPRPIPNREVVLARLEPSFRAVAVFLLETGLRISEACSVSVDLPVPDDLNVVGKGSKERIVPLNDAAKEALTFLGGRIPFKVRAIQASFRAAGFKAHACRHTYASDLAEGGVDVADIAKLLGHANVQTSMGYAHYSRRRIRDAVERKGRVA